MRLSNINRVQWVHRVALQQIGVDPDSYFYDILEDENEEKKTDLEIMSAMQTALQSENDEVVGRPPFHLRNGDLILWTDISWKQNDKGSKLKKNPNFKGSAKDKFLAKMREPQSLKIRTYQEFMEDERMKKEKESETTAKDE